LCARIFLRATEAAPKGTVTLGPHFATPRFCHRTARPAFSASKAFLQFAAIGILIFFAFPFHAAAQSPLLIANTSSPLVQNARADADNLTRMRDVSMIRTFARGGYLVPVAANSRFYYLHGVPSSYRYCRPWTKLFLDRLGREYFAKFGARLRITSLVRSVTQQRALARRNDNAADATGSHRSSHLTGATLDISKRFMSARGKNWMRRVLYSLKRAGYLYPIEEFQQPVFHVMVYRNYPVYVARLDERRRSRGSELAQDSSADAPGDKGAD